MSVPNWRTCKAHRVFKNKRWVYCNAKKQYIGDKYGDMGGDGIHDPNNPNDICEHCDIPTNETLFKDGGERR